MASEKSENNSEKRANSVPASNIGGGKEIKSIIPRERYANEMKNTLFSLSNP